MERGRGRNDVVFWVYDGGFLRGVRGGLQDRLRPHQGPAGAGRTAGKASSAHGGINQRDGGHYAGAETDE